MNIKFCLEESNVIRFPIGDWSNDGHGKCVYFFASCNKSVEQLREIHFSCIEKLGFDIGDICRKYRDREISPKILEILIKNKVIDPEELSEDEYTEPSYLFDLWLRILKFLEPSFVYEIYEPKFVDINFYGFDEQKRHLNTPGYGLYN